MLPAVTASPTAFSDVIPLCLVARGETVSQGLHGIEEAIWPRRKRHEIVTQIESTRSFVLRVDNDHRRSDFAGISKSALERIQEQQPTDSLTSKVFADS
jgi:hypothetical protein